MGVGDVLHPVDRLAVEGLLDGDMGHGGRWRGAVPVLLARREPDDVAWTDFLDRPAVSLDRPNPAVTINVWPSGWVCQAVLAPGSNVTRARRRAPAPAR